MILVLIGEASSTARLIGAMLMQISKTERKIASVFFIKIFLFMNLEEKPLPQSGAVIATLISLHRLYYINGANVNRFFAFILFIFLRKS